MTILKTTPNLTETITLNSELDMTLTIGYTEHEALSDCYAVITHAYIEQDTDLMPYTALNLNNSVNRLKIKNLFVANTFFENAFYDESDLIVYDNQVMAERAEA